LNRSRARRRKVSPARSGRRLGTEVLTLLDRDTGKVLTITPWNSKEDLQASEESANAVRTQAADIASEKISGVERYEVTFQDMP
jgi:heme-degrading monooxygenase HmoA